MHLTIHLGHKSVVVGGVRNIPTFPALAWPPAPKNCHTTPTTAVNPLMQNWPVVVVAG